MMTAENQNDKPLTKVISGSGAEAFQRWDMPIVGEQPAELNIEEAPRVLTDAQIEEIKQAAYEQAFEQGKAEGYQAGLAEAQHCTGQIQALMEAFTQPFAQQNNDIEEQLVRLAMVVARQMVRRELNIDPSHVLGVVREAMQALPVNASDARLHLHPEDAALVREVLGDLDADRTWKIKEDSMMTRGGCRIVANETRIDESFETRMGRVVSNVLGGLRDGDADDA